MRLSLARLVVVAGSLSAASCNCGGGPGSDGGSDGGAMDSGAMDSGAMDSGAMDSGAMDSGAVDSGAVDSGAVDSGAVDSGAVDSGTMDSGAADAGPPDAGTSRDDGGCPLPTGLVLNAADAGLPPGLVLWLRADLGVATFDGGAVCRWEDVSGNGRHFTPPVASYPRFEPTVINGRPAVVFSTNTRLERTDVLGLGPTQPRTIAVRSQVADTTRRFGSFLQGNRNNNWEYLELEQNTFNTVGSRVGVYLTANAYDSDLPTSTAARTHLYAISNLTPGTTLPGALFYAVDGVARTLTRTPGGNGPSGPGNNMVWSFADAGFTSVGETAAAGFTGGAIGEVIVFDHALTAPERTAVEAHLGR